jgi:CubicO group peptidase (beta-lactamase class C family)
MPALAWPNQSPDIGFQDQSPISGPYLGVIMIARIFTALLLAGACPAQDNVARMEQVVQAYVSGKQFMGSVLVARDGRVMLDKGYGFANLEWDVPNTPASKFRLGSVTKQFTAACILLLEERGKLKVDDSVKKYLPDAPAAWDRVTIFHLLTHTSGIPSFTSFPDYRATEATPTTVEKLVARFRDKPLEFVPGEKWSYSNSGYVLLGYLIEKITGQKYADFVQENIFKPLGMTESGYDSNTAIILHRASGYAPGPKGPVNAGYIDMSVPHAAGALYSTTGDLLHWLQGLFGGELLQAESLRKMTTPFKDNYAFGLSVRTVNGHTVIDHGGGIEGFNTHVAYYPETRVAVIVLGNLNGSAPSELASRLGAVALGETVVLPSERKAVVVAPTILADYAGTYEVSPQFRIVMTVEDNQLMTQATGQSKFPLFAESETKFFLKVVDAEIEFFRDGAGKVTHVVVHQGGRDLKAERK